MDMENILEEFDKALKSGKSLNKKPTNFLKIWKQLDEKTQLEFSVEISKLLQTRSDNEHPISIKQYKYLFDKLN